MKIILLVLNWQACFWIGCTQKESTVTSHLVCLGMQWVSINGVRQPAFEDIGGDFFNLSELWHSLMVQHIDKKCPYLVFEFNWQWNIILTKALRTKVLTAEMSRNLSSQDVHLSHQSDSTRWEICIQNITHPMVTNTGNELKQIHIGLIW